LLPIPDPNAVKSWWEKTRPVFRQGLRHLFALTLTLSLLLALLSALSLSPGLPVDELTSILAVTYQR